MRSTETPWFSARRPSSDVFGAIGNIHRVNIPQQATQPVQLIQQVQNDRNALVVHTEIHLEIPDQPHPREVGVRKVKRLRETVMSFHLLLYPGIQLRTNTQ